MSSMAILVSARAFLVAGCLALSVTACGSSAKVLVTRPVQGDLGKYHGVQIEHSGSGSRENRAAKQFATRLGKQLVEHGYFKQVGDDGEVVFKVRATQLEAGEEVKRELSLKGKASVTLEIRIEEAGGKLLGQFTVRASAARKDKDDQPALRALDEATDEVIEYLERTQPKKAPKVSAKKKPAANGKEKSTSKAAESDSGEEDAPKDSEESGESKTKEKASDGE